MTTVAQFEIEFIQCINEHGGSCGSLPAFANNDQVLQELYRIMVRTRIFDRKAIALQRTGKMGTYAPINGQEAISTAIGHAMRAEDVLIPYYRDYAAQFQRGVKMSEILAYWGGDERGSHFANNKEDLPICVPIASQCLHAAGVAFAFKYRHQPRVAVTCIGEGGTSEGDFYEAMNVAGAWKLPVVLLSITISGLYLFHFQSRRPHRLLHKKQLLPDLPGCRSMEMMCLPAGKLLERPSKKPDAVRALP